MANYVLPEIELTDAEVRAKAISRGNRVGNGSTTDIDSGLRTAMENLEFREETTGHEADTIVEDGGN